jgi:DNA-binding Lrp family transcriptional regulator
MAFPILKYLVTSTEPKSPYRIEDEVGIDKPTVLNTVSKLEKAEFIKPGTEPIRCRDGRIWKKYVICPRGIVALLQARDQNLIALDLEDVRKISGTWKRERSENKEAVSFLPLVFGKWGYFQDKKVEDIAFNLLLKSVSSENEKTIQEVDLFRRISTRNKKIGVYNSSPVSESWDGMIAELADELPIDLDRIHRHDIYRFMLAEWDRVLVNNEEARKWLTTIKCDEKLREMATIHLSALRNQKEEDLELDNEILKILDSPSETIAKKALSVHVFLTSSRNLNVQRLHDKLLRSSEARAIDKGVMPPTRSECRMMAFHLSKTFLDAAEAGRKALKTGAGLEETKRVLDKGVSSAVHPEEREVLEFLRSHIPRWWREARRQKARKQVAIASRKNDVRRT